MIETRRGQIRQDLIDLARDMASDVAGNYAELYLGRRLGKHVEVEVEQALRAIFSKLEIPNE